MQIGASDRCSTLEVRPINGPLRSAKKQLNEKKIFTEKASDSSKRASPNTPMALDPTLRLRP